MRDRPEERWARDVVVAELGVPAHLYDDGRTQGMPDVLIHGPSGIEPLEVVTAHDDEYLRMSAALKQLGRRIDIAPSSQAWAVSLIHARANVKGLRRQLPDLIIAHETLLRLEVVPEVLERLGIEDAHPLDGEYGYIRLLPAGWNSWDYGQSFSDWLDDFLDRHNDVPRKLAEHGGARQHAFIWVGSAAAWSANDQLEAWDDDEPPPLPERDPRVPESITDVWVASLLVGRPRGMLRWVRGAGWSIVPLVLPPDAIER
ncbi:hypothetical protein [Microbacterium sp. AG238]|uniref:hypothetical protein n=1 Tax=Microbacterium sp. AG238 TaxID=2183994 RepID=UPI0011C45E4F|nr:hypothetical protein [Microbacterium sp. AG238]